MDIEGISKLDQHLQYIVYCEIQEYHCFFIERATMYLAYGSIWYCLQYDSMNVRVIECLQNGQLKRTISECFFNCQISPIYHSSEVFLQNKWYTIGKDNFIVRIVTQQYQKKIDYSLAQIRQDSRKITHTSQYYTERTGTRRKYAKLSIGADVLQ